MTVDRSPLLHHGKLQGTHYRWLEEHWLLLIDKTTQYVHAPSVLICPLTRPADSGATVTFLLRSPAVFADDRAIQPFVASGKARLVQGDALVKEDVQRAWTEAGKGDDNRPVDLLVFTVGEHEKQSL